MSRYKNIDQNCSVKKTDGYLENVAKLACFSKDTKENYIHTNIKSKLNWGKAC
jgi:hypothetical protein